MTMNHRKEEKCNGQRNHNRLPHGLIQLLLSAPLAFIVLLLIAHTALAVEFLYKWGSFAATSALIYGVAVSQRGSLRFSVVLRVSRFGRSDSGSVAFTLGKRLPCRAFIVLRFLRQEEYLIHPICPSGSLSKN